MLSTGLGSRLLTSGGDASDSDDELLDGEDEEAEPEGRGAPPPRARMSAKRATPAAATIKGFSGILSPFVRAWPDAIPALSIGD